MTRLGFYIINNLRYKLVCTIDVPWNFETNSEDEPSSEEDGPLIGEWTGEQGEIPAEDVGESGGEQDNEGIMALSEEDTSESEETPSEQPRFEDWIVDYYKLVLNKDDEFMSLFNRERTYVIISFDKEDVMGLFNIHKGWTYINFKEFDYRVLINKLFPNIRQDMIIKDESFGGYDEDEQFQVDAAQEVEEDYGHKTLATYPNLIYHLCIGHFEHPHYHKT